MPFTSQSPGAAEAGGKIYLIGGSDWYNLNTSAFYDPAYNNWTMIKDMPIYRASMGTVALGGKIYAMGGYVGKMGGYSIGKSAVVYDPGNNTWSLIADMPIERSSMGTAALNNKIYVMGGVGGENGIYDAMPTCAVYNPATNTWNTTIADMPHSRYGTSAVELNGKIYVIGGQGSDDGFLNSSVVYNPTNDTWSSIPDMPAGRARMSAVALNGKIYVMGGYAGGTYNFKSCVVYDPDTQHWSTITDMPITRALSAAAAYNNKIYVMGGEQTGGASAVIYNLPA